MSRKWLEKEGYHWVEEGIITSSQHETLLNRYPQKQRLQKALPVLASLLIGLGILSFVASNWSGVPALVKLLFLTVLVVGFYTVGWKQHQKGSEGIGIGLTLLGVLSFGASIFLIEQMFHLQLDNTLHFLVWSLAAIACMYLYQSRILAILSLILLLTTQLVSFFSIEHVHYLTFVVLVVGVGYYLKKHSSSFVMALFILITLLHVEFILLSWGLSFAWILPVILCVYALGDHVQTKQIRIIKPLSLIVGYILTFVFVMSEELLQISSSVERGVFIGVSVLVIVLSLVSKYKREKMTTGWELLLWLPLLTLDLPGMVYILCLFGFSLYLLFHGFHENQRHIVNLGIVSFLFSTCAGYLNLAWAFMDKSLLFIFGGLLLFFLHSFLQKKKKAWFSQEDGESK